MTVLFIYPQCHMHYNHVNQYNIMKHTATVKTLYNLINCYSRQFYMLSMLTTFCHDVNAAKDPRTSVAVHQCM